MWFGKPLMSPGKSSMSASIEDREGQCWYVLDPAFPPVYIVVLSTRWTTEQSDRALHRVVGVLKVPYYHAEWDMVEAPGCRWEFDEEMIRVDDDAR